MYQVFVQEVIKGKGSRKSPKYSKPQLEKEYQTEDEALRRKISILSNDSTKKVTISRSN